MLIAKGMIALAATTLATGAAAQDVTSTQMLAVSPDTQCELHVWPAERFNAITTGWLVALGPLGAVAEAAGNADKNKDHRTKIGAALDPQGQLDALTALDLTTSLGQQPAKIITHAEALDRKTINKISTRRAQSTSPCYSELITADVMYQKAAIYGRSLRTLFLYRNFGSAQDKPKMYKAWGGNGLKLFPAKTGEDTQAADAELVSVFKANFQEFARNASKKALASK